MKKLAIASALIAGVGVQQPLRAQVWLTAETPSITSVYSMIFYQSPGPWEKLPIRLNLTPAEIKDLVPARSGKFAMIGMTCSGISANKHLEGCKINAEPKDAGYEAVGSELAKRVVVDPAFSMDSKSAGEIHQPPIQDREFRCARRFGSVLAALLHSRTRAASATSAKMKDGLTSAFQPGLLDQTSTSTQIGAWSLLFSQPRGVRSTPAASSFFASGGLSSAWSMRIPASRSNEFRQ